VAAAQTAAVRRTVTALNRAPGVTENGVVGIGQQHLGAELRTKRGEQFLQQHR
jgi:hypothetical protein